MVDGSDSDCDTVIGMTTKKRKKTNKAAKDEDEKIGVDNEEDAFATQEFVDDSVEAYYKQHNELNFLSDPLNSAISDYLKSKVTTDAELFEKPASQYRDMLGSGNRPADQGVPQPKEVPSNDGVGSTTTTTSDALKLPPRRPTKTFTGELKLPPRRGSFRGNGRSSRVINDDTVTEILDDDLENDYAALEEE